MIKENKKRNKHYGLWYDVGRRLLRNKLAIVGFTYIIFLILLSLTASLFLNYDNAIDISMNILKAPSKAHIFGTDSLGRDMFTRIVYGTRISLVTAFASTVTAIIFGGTIGAFSGYYGKNFDLIVMRLMDIIYAIPRILLAIAIVSAFGANVLTLMIALSVHGIASYSRIVRASVIEAKEQDYIEAISSCGAGDLRILFMHIIPNSLSPIIVRATLGIGGSIIAIASLSFLGMGIQPPTPEWGRILAENQEYFDRLYLTAIPGLAIVTVVLAFNFLGDGLRDALDPKLK